MIDVLPIEILTESCVLCKLIGLTDNSTMLLGESYPFMNTLMTGLSLAPKAFPMFVITLAVLFYI